MRLKYGIIFFWKGIILGRFSFPFLKWEPCSDLISRILNLHTPTWVSLFHFKDKLVRQRKPLSSVCASWPKASAGLVSGELTVWKWAKQISVISGGRQATQDHLLFPKHALSVLSLVSWWSSFWPSFTPLLLFLPFGLRFRIVLIPLLSSLDTFISRSCKVPFLLYEFIFLLISDYHIHSPFPRHSVKCVCLMCDSF